MPNKEPFTFHAKLDRQALYLYYGGNLSYACDMFGAFLEEGPDAADRLLRLLRACDRPGLVAALHKVQPCLAMVGLSPLADRAAVIRDQLHASQDLAGSVPAIRALIKDLQAYLPLIRQELTRMRQVLSN